MSLPSQCPSQIRFGEFELDLQTAELRTNGHKFTLQGQPFQVLAILLQRPGELITREELKKRLWPSETFGDFDRGLNRAVNRLREALQDSADQPRFIETLPKRGYRFIGSGVPPANASGPSALVTKWSERSKAAITLGVLIVLTLAMASTWYLRFRRHSSIESVAVLAFGNQTAYPNADYLSDGIAENLIDSLSQIPDLAVRPRSSMSRYKGREVDPQVIARELNVQAIISGRIRQHGDSLAVSVELVDARNNRNLWGENYDGKLSDVLGIQRDIVLGVSTHLRENLPPEQKAHVTRSATADPEAYQWYLKGRYLWEMRTPDALEKARDYFNQAIARDPTFAQAYVGLADYWAVAPDFLHVALSESLPNEKAAALKAQALNNDSPGAHLALANAFYDNWEWENAEREFQRALEIDPRFANAHHWYGLSLSWLGRHQEALTHLQRAVDLDPFNLKYRANLGEGYQNARHYDLALDQLNQTIAIDPKFAIGYGELGDLYRALGKYDLWLLNWKKKQALNKNPYRITLIEQLSRAYAEGGYPAAVRQIIELQKQALPQRYVDPADIAYEYAALGNRKEAFRWLDMAYAERSRSLQVIQVAPSMDALRSDARYGNLLRRMGIRR